MSIITATSIVMPTAYAEDTGFLETGREKTLITIESAGLASLASDCGCAAEDINSVFMVFEHVETGNIEVLRFSVFDEEPKLTAHVDGFASDEEGIYRETLRTVMVNTSESYRFYKETNLTIPEEFSFIKINVDDETIWDCLFFDPDPSDQYLDCGDYDDEQDGLPLDLEGF